VLAGARVIELGEDPFTMGYRVVSVAEEAVAAEGTGFIVSFDYRARAKAPVLDVVRRAILTMDPKLGRTPAGDS